MRAITEGNLALGRIYALLALEELPLFRNQPALPPVTVNPHPLNPPLPAITKIPSPPDHMPTAFDWGLVDCAASGNFNSLLQGLFTMGEVSPPVDAVLFGVAITQYLGRDQLQCAVAFLKQQLVHQGQG